MARVHFRIIAALIALSVLTVTVLGGYYMYREKFLPERERKQEIRELLEAKAPKVDPGKRIHDQAIGLIRDGELEAARELLTQIIEVHRDSERYGAARALLGEMNMDRLFSRTPMPGKLEYTVGRTRQDNLNAISAKFRTTVPYIKRVNNLTGNVIHPGDRLVLYPLDFEIEVRLADKILTLLRDGRYFKDYNILGHHLPFPKLGKETTIAETSGWWNERKLRPGDEAFVWAEKRLQTASRGSRGGITFRPAPPEPPASPAPPEGAPPPPAGIYLSAADMQELVIVVRPGIPLRFL
jgi:hypothetical protein